MSVMTTTAPQSTHWHPTAGERFDAVAPGIGSPPIYGPPVAFLLGPWLLLVFLIIPPAAFLITLVLVAAASTGLVLAIVAPPYLLVRHLHAHHAARRQSPVVHRPARPATAVSEVAGPRGWRPVGAHLVPLATR